MHALGQEEEKANYDKCFLIANLASQGYNQPNHSPDTVCPGSS